MKQCRFCDNSIPYYGSDTCEECKRNALQRDEAIRNDAKLLIGYARIGNGLFCRVGRQRSK